MTAQAILNPGSFRDPGGRVFHSGELILRAIMESAAEQFRHANQSGVLSRLVEQKQLVDFEDVTEMAPALGVEEVQLLLSHPRIPFVSYPYEWSFSLHKAAALFHLDLQLDLLRDGFALSDATAYNVQFDGIHPVFIDHLSIRRYVEGEIWSGHRQFCMQFLNPLLMWSALDVPPNHWFRGALEGIAPEDLAKLLPLKKRLGWTVLTHVVAQAAMQNRSVKAGVGSVKYRNTKLPRSGFEGILRGLRSSIAKMEVPSHKTVWGDYAQNTSYGAPEEEEKHAFVREMISAIQPQLVYDLGCNSGDYSRTALASGADKVVGFDFDHGALEIAYRRAREENLNLLPVWLDATNPSPQQGWGQAERAGLAFRAKPQAMLALALIHHIAIGKNVPLDMAIDWLIATAPQGIIEFPHKSDPMVQILLSQRPDIFPNYSNENFAELLSQRARIVVKKDVLSTRTLYWYDRS